MNTVEQGGVQFQNVREVEFAPLSENELELVGGGQATVNTV
jgi:hypothetical protein